MTFSIVARSADGRFHGVAVASKFLAVGAAVPAAEAEVGALATQAYANLAYRPQGLALLRTGLPADQVVAALVAADRGRAQRQIGVVGPDGDGATYTGDGCHDWAGGLAGPGWAVQGNILAGPQVLDAMRDAWLAGTEQQRFAERLVAALHAGDRAGGDRRGRQSAAVLVVAKDSGYGGTSDIAVDLRVDDHPDPVAELTRLLGVHVMLFERPDPATLLELTGPLADEVRDLLAAAGHGRAELDDALASWAGVENLEERLAPGRIDPVVLAHLRTTTSAKLG
ncbi:Uncharacterized conserved protein, Ntn-hydrolase superfamily [Micromonospora pattaloongensis]|uniref:Uncharacterized conserved protein, Ntn-hydrolase superfamily n=1 Tax=Micromonospora pattaloongensis TaxID=405436 RepID=A0A1H3R8D1_9ACTN|nr:DUF1028 domain-containing protein [Micromonospora pattaloongensis]SDZ22082.1 Uncharacterized conserved protein, Ntn-hydrolase superfamily [Micromonospora pattaloongensis]